MKNLIMLLCVVYFAITLSGCAAVVAGALIHGNNKRIDETQRMVIRSNYTTENAIRMNNDLERIDWCVYLNNLSPELAESDIECEDRFLAVKLGLNINALTEYTTLSDSTIIEIEQYKHNIRRSSHRSMIEDN